jgi:fibronectin type 3 domain-containing protein
MPKNLRRLIRNKNFSKRILPAIIIFCVAIIGTITLLLSHAATPGPVPVGNPYIDPSQLTSLGANGKISFYDEPWRAYMQTEPATKFLSGIGVNYDYGSTSPTIIDSNMQYLASIGIHAIRIELPWGDVDPSNETQLVPSEQAYYTAVFQACAKYGITPTILLNANDGSPEPAYPTITTPTVGIPTIGASTLNVTGVNASQITVHQQGTTIGGSGYDLGVGYENGNFITKVVTNSDGSLTLTLSQPIKGLPSKDAITNSSGTITGYNLVMTYMKYMPFYPVGTPEFTNTAAGWLQYVKDASGVAEAAGLTNYSVEVWNELSFGSKFVGINDYYPSLVQAPSVDGLLKGGTMWQIANETTQYLKGAYGNNVKVIWGWSNTTFYHTAIQDLPPNIDGESYHPYGTNAITAPNVIAMDVGSQNYLREGTYIPNITIAIPEGNTALSIRLEQLIKGHLQPLDRQGSNPPGTSNFLYYITETATAPGSEGPVVPANLYGFSQLAATKPPSESDTLLANQLIAAKSDLREYSYWLNKGLDQFDLYTAFSNKGDVNNVGFGLLAPGADATGTNQQTLQSESLQNFTGQFAGATNLTSPRNIGATVSDITPNEDSSYDVFPADTSGLTNEPTLNYNQMFQFLPTQVTNNKFVIPTYIMSWDIANSPPPMDFQVDITNVNGNAANVSYYDPILNSNEPVTVVSRSANDIVVDIQDVDYPRTLTINEGNTANNLPSNMAPPTLSTPTINVPNNSNGSSSYDQTTNTYTVRGTVAANDVASDSATGSPTVSFQLYNLSQDSYAEIGQGIYPGPYTENWDTTGVENGTYTLKTRATDIYANIASSSTVNVVVNNPTVTPPPVTGLTASVEDSSMALLNWNDNTTNRIIGYNIYRDGSATPIRTLRANDTASWTDPTVTPGQTYTYTIAALDETGLAGPTSAPVSITMPAAPVGGNSTLTVSLSAPANNATVSGTSVPLSANASDNVGISRVQFQVNGVGLKPIPTTSPYSIVWDTTAVDKNGIEYYPNDSYTVTAVATDNADNIVTSKPVTVKVNNPNGCSYPAIDTAPSGLKIANASNAAVSLNWLAGAPSKNCKIGVYEIFRNGAFLNNVGASTLLYTDKTLAPSTTYVYNVATLDSGDNTAESGSVSYTTPGDNIAPSIPANLTAKASGPGSIDLSWTASTDNIGGSGMLGYDIYRNNSSTPTFVVSGGNNTSFTDTTVKPSTTYKYDITALDNSNNESAPSSIVSATTPSASCTANPSQPTNLVASGSTLTTASFSWTASTVANGCTIAGYHIYRDGTYLKDVTSGTSFTDTNLSSNTSYSYTVAAFDNSANSSNQTAPLVISTLADTSPPSVPGSLTALVNNSGQVSLAWNASTDNVGVSGYNIYRNGQLLTSVDSSILFYVDTTVQPSTTYTYQVSAFDATTNESAKASSTPPTVTTPSTVNNAPPTPPTNIQAGIIAAHSASLTWKASTDKTGVKGYHVYLNGVYYGDTTTVGVALNCIAPAVTYDVSVKAFDSAGRVSQPASTNLTTLSKGGLPGDLDCNGVVNSTDLFTLLRNWQQTGVLPPAGDVNGDTNVTSIDLFDLLRNWGVNDNE